MEADKAVTYSPHRKDSSLDDQFEGVHGAAPRHRAFLNLHLSPVEMQSYGQAALLWILIISWGQHKVLWTLIILFPTSSLHRNPRAGGRPGSYSRASWHSSLTQEWERNNHAANWHNYVNNSQAPKQTEMMARLFPEAVIVI